MIKLNGEVTDRENFFQGADPFELIEKYGSPLYIYNERILRQRVREMKNLVSYENFRVNFSAKANSNIAFLQIVKDEGIDVDAMSPGEIEAELMAGFKPENILYISNNVSEEEMQYAINKGIKTSVDSLSQLEQYGRLNPGGKVAVRFNPGVGAGHHKKVITGGKETKFGVNEEYIPQVKEILEKYSLTLIGINQHIGSLFMDGGSYIEGAKNLINIAKHFEDLEFIDLGGGFGIPYKKQYGEERLNLSGLGEKLSEFIEAFVSEYGKKLIFKIEPGRYISAECGLLLGQVHAVKMNGDEKYIGTDLGFNVLARPMMYDSFHGIEVYTKRENPEKVTEIASIVGNICETGDIIAGKRELPVIHEGDIIGVLDAGAYGMVMSSNYNNRLRPAEVFIRENGEVKLVRKRDNIEDLLKNYISL
ncbi:diaminopimelate decarboxylase [Anaeropeptidivorans aminofermentans]|jgi:diaminopimelate decarboxylase|uniref:diaminopimelate decarboxylase n=1 Tax=Anaeropeptidivorans aminofermentans TaxID=2934315 RepID=UPI0020246359|nr:diaminopimelate decarboxylase [Anaeropeptidivorans aminofermentans]